MLLSQFKLGITRDSYSKTNATTYLNILTVIQTMRDRKCKDSSINKRRNKKEDNRKISTFTTTKSKKVALL